MATIYIITHVPSLAVGLDSHVMYPNGISCTLPEDVQEDLIHTIPGLEEAKLIYPGNSITNMNSLVVKPVLL